MSKLPTEEILHDHPMPAQSESETARAIYDALLDPKRIEAMNDCDRNLLFYNPHSFLLVFRLRGRHFGMLLFPLTSLLIWDLFWGLFLITYGDPLELIESLQGMENLISPMLIPVSFLLVFRLGRAAVRYWEARAALGKLVEVCRTTASTALVGCRRGPTICAEEQGRQRQLAEGFVRWIAVLPLAVKNFLRPRQGLLCNRTREIGDLLSPEERQEFLDIQGQNVYAPILALNRIRQLAYRLSYSPTQGSSSPELDAAMNGVLFRQLNEQIDLLTGAWGAMERINGTPLPFVYVVHLRTFLLLYLFLWHMQAIAMSGWVALIPLQLASWGLLGIEAAAVECERPFRYHSSHLALGKASIVVAQNVAQTYANLGWLTQQTISAG